MTRPTFLDGPLGTELERRGVALPPPAWTAAALEQAPDTVVAIHAEYAAAGAEVHTTNTFRTRDCCLAGTPWAGRGAALAATAVALCRDGAGPEARVAGSLAPLADCYRPDLTPDDADLQREHTALARILAASGCDLLLVETMPTARELSIATCAAVATGLPVWSAITLGPRGDFFDRTGVLSAWAQAAEAGAEAFLINCVPADRITPVLATLCDRAAGDGPALGAYGNTIFSAAGEWSPERYADEAVAWADLGAGIVGGCCGTTPAHLAALTDRFG